MSTHFLILTIALFFSTSVCTAQYASITYTPAFYGSLKGYSSAVLNSFKGNFNTSNFFTMVAHVEVGKSQSPYITGVYSLNSPSDDITKFQLCSTIREQGVIIKQIDMVNSGVCLITGSGAHPFSLGILSSQQFVENQLTYTVNNKTIECIATPKITYFASRYRYFVAYFTNFKIQYDPTCSYEGKLLGNI
jgi:hypothetical protein